jgi:hypothetical protein
MGFDELIECLIIKIIIIFFESEELMVDLISLQNQTILTVVLNSNNEFKVNQLFFSQIYKF